MHLSFIDGFTETLRIPLRLLQFLSLRISAEGEKTVDVTRKIANLQLKDKRRHLPCLQKPSLPTWGQLKALCTKEEAIPKNIEPRIT